MLITDTFSWEVPLQNEDGKVFDYRFTCRWSPDKDFVAPGVAASARAQAIVEQKKHFVVAGAPKLLSNLTSVPNDAA